MWIYLVEFSDLTHSLHRSASALRALALGERGHVMRI